VVQSPEAQKSGPLQNVPSLQGVPSALFAPLMQASVPSSQVPVLHDVSDAEQSSAAPVQVPLEQASGSVQNNPSVQALPSGSSPLQSLAVSSQVSVQSPSPSAPAHGLDVPEQVPLEQVSVRVQ
jgi:hypothetical protein